MKHLKGHTKSVNSLAVTPGRNLLVSGAADSTVKVWRIQFLNQKWDSCLLQTLELSPKFFPLALALSSVESHDTFLAVAGTRGAIHIYTTERSKNLSIQATLGGHEGWIRSLAIHSETHRTGSDYLLASASQDKYIRIWRIHKESISTDNGQVQSNDLADLEMALSNKAHHLKTAHNSYILTFEALLLGHDDWVYTVDWKFVAGRLKLLSSSADNSLAIWDSESESGVWVCKTRLGEISAQKGSTTATGSAGGFWIGLWSPDGQNVVSLARTGGWRLWNFDRDQERWLQGVGISGHVKAVTNVAWARNGSYILSTSADQTTRLHAEWCKGSQRSWHEFGRPQIHGYALNCLDTIDRVQFISGADEKLLRVFEEPKSTAELLRRLCGIPMSVDQILPEAANIPVLGLSNKAVENDGDHKSSGTSVINDESGALFASASHMSLKDLECPPFEDDLSRHTLWPEKEKLYGHGHEISAVASSTDGSIVATACKASSVDHAVIRLFETMGWREINSPLTAHSLTVTCLKFTKDDQYLLSTGRDRQWAIFERDEEDPRMYRSKATRQKAHLRMILSACWVPDLSQRAFFTAGRDKSIKVWRLQGTGAEQLTTITASSPITAIDVCRRDQDTCILAVGTEHGEISVYLMDWINFAIRSCQALDDS